MDENLTSISRRFTDWSNRQRGRILSLNRKTLLGLFMALYVLGGLGMGWMFVAAYVLPPTPAQGDQPTGVEREQSVGAEVVPVPGPETDQQFEIPSKPPSDPRMSFLLLGYGGGSHDGAYLTDSIMLAVADPSQKTLTLLSVPRDCWVPLLFDGKTALYSKLNTAYAFARDPSLYRGRLPRYTGGHGAGNFAADTMSRLLGVPISNYLALDFEGFRQMIDAVGGIDVNIPNSFAASYPANDDPSIDSSWTVVRFNKGVQHMSGERAIQFARAREALDNMSEGTDFARSQRQRLIMEAFKTRLFEPTGLLRLPQILAIAARHVDTDYPILEVGQLSQFLLGWKDVRIFQAALTTDNYLASGTGPGGAYVAIPSSADHSWSQIRAFARRLWEDPASGVAMAETKVVVVNNTGEPSLAARLSTALAKLGYRVGIPVPGQPRAESRLIDRTGGKASALAAQLEKDLGVQFQQVTEAPVGKAAEVVLELGMNDKSLADLVVPADGDAPYSTVGVENFAGWVPWIPEPSPEPIDTATPAETSETDLGADETTPPADSPQPPSVPRLTATPAEGLQLLPTPGATIVPTEGPMPRSTSKATPGPTGTVVHQSTPTPDATPQRAPTSASPAVHTSTPAPPSPDATAAKTVVSTPQPSATPTP
ncbi:MAG: hypothetical protein EPO21_05995 [Chloroflexota bacterium]|nr:MAG: hypothetical protein EPO21_05995 [Chloroflexota bacterium]